MHHELKIWTKYFDVVQRGDKPFEIRKADRDFTVGDTLVLHEWEPGTQTLGDSLGKQGYYTGRRTEKVVVYILPGGQFGIENGYVAMGIR